MHKLSHWQSLVIRTLLISIIGLTPLLANDLLGNNSPGLGEPWIVDTAISEPLQSHVFQIPPSVTLESRLHYEVGFATFEPPQLNFLFDSITVSIARANGSESTILVTADVFGLTIAPLAPGGLLSKGGINVTAVTPAIQLFENAPISFAYNIEISLPSSLAGDELQTSFQFFNNGDSVASQAYAIVVPEPSVFALAVIGGALGILHWKRKGRCKW